MLGRRIRGIKLGRKLVCVFRWTFSRRKPTATTRYHQLTHNEQHQSKNRAISNLRKWGRSISRGAKEICSPRSHHTSSSSPTARFLNSTFSNYIRISHGYDDDVESPSGSGGSGSWRNRRKRMIGSVPKGHLAVYIGDEEEKERVLVPVIYLNHPLFEKLLKEAEEVYGFDQPGRITIPCPISEFEHVQTQIDYFQSGKWGRRPITC